MNKIIIAIDGHSSTGKSTVAKAIAKKLGYIYVDTGAMYRAVTLYCMKHGIIDKEGNIDRKKLNDSLEGISIEFRLNPINNLADTFLNGENVESEIRSIDVASKVSAVSAIPEVRMMLVRRQQAMGTQKGIVMDGRDIGTVVFPDAELKIFMTADPKIRAERRFKELTDKGEKLNFEDVLKNIEERDYLDTHREVSPLRQAEDALILDNTSLSPDEQLAWIEEKVREVSSEVKVEIDDKSGFCYGVVRAIERAEKELDTYGELFSLGEIVHNTVEVERLAKKGLSVTSKQLMHEVQGKKVLIRAHGEPPSTYKLAQQNKIEIIDCTCPVVLKLQERIKNAYDKCLLENGQIVIFGKRGHAEVNGLVGQTNNQAIVVECPEDIQNIDFRRPIYLFSQTTKSLEDYELLQKNILQQIKDIGGDVSKLVAKNTTCHQVTGRIPDLKEFSKKYEVILFVSGKQSSNGKVLFNVCKDINPNTHFVETDKDFDPQWIRGYKSIGVCGATSTPKWLLEEVASSIQNYIKNNRNK